MKRFFSWLWRSLFEYQQTQKAPVKFEPRRTELRFRWISIAPRLLLDVNTQAK
jgi:hypothetical protein